MSSSVPEWRSYPSFSSSLPGIPDAAISIHPLYRIARLAAAARTSAAPGVLHFACSQPLFTLEGKRSRYEAGFTFRQQVVVCAVQPLSVVPGLSKEAEAQVAVALIVVVVFITFLLFVQTLRRPRERSGSSCIIQYSSSIR
jgi:hypothetical protein